MVPLFPGTMDVGTEVKDVLVEEANKFTRLTLSLIIFTEF